MAGGVTQTGMREYDRALSAMPGVVRAQLEGVARRAAMRLQGATRASASAYDWQLARDIRVAHLPSEQRFVVGVNPAPRRPANLPLWLEFGTRFMAPRTFWYRHVNEVAAAYPGEVDRGLQAAYDQTVNR